MNTSDLQEMVPGFENPSLDSQAVFRVALDAFSHPGRVLDIPLNAAWPSGCRGTPAVLLLSLLDADTRVWLSPSLMHDNAAAWLRFHTGCNVVDDPGNAQFLWMAQSDPMPWLTELCLGSDEYPDQSATLVIEVLELQPGLSGWHLAGPGIEGVRKLGVLGAPLDFEHQWRLNCDAFPRGVDIFFTTENQIAGLTRTTRIMAGE